MFGQVQPSKFDLYFPLFGIPVRVTPMFWIITVLINFDLVRKERLDLLLIWAACLFVSILIHEMGHALAARHYGWPPEVYLHGFGGVAIFYPHSGYTPFRATVIALWGPFAGFLLFGLVLAVGIGVGSADLLTNVSPKVAEYLNFTFLQLIWINLIWGLVNLIPALPLDGGRVCSAICSSLSPRRGEEIAIKISIVTAGLVAIGFGVLQMLFAALLFGLICFQNVQLLNQYRGRW